MIQLYSAFNLKNVISDQNALFAVDTCAEHFTSVDEEIVYALDKATFLDDKQEIIQTAYGSAIVDALSSGTKTVLNYLHCKKHLVLSIDACGPNALYELFSRYDEALPAQLALSVMPSDTRLSGFTFALDDKPNLTQAQVISLLIDKEDSDDI